MAAHAETWRYQEPAGFARFEGLPSPPFAATDPSSPLLEYASFLEPLSKFSLDDDEPVELQHSPNAPRGSTAAPEQTGNSLSTSPTHNQFRGIPLCRQHSKDLELLVQSAFDEMDVELAKRSKLSAGAPAFTPTAEASPPTAELNMELEPTVEEQEWLDQQCDAMEHAAQLEAEVEAEERFVQRMLEQHPTLHVDEARRLYDVEYPSSPELLASPRLRPSQPPAGL